MEMTVREALEKGIDAHKAGRLEEADRFYTSILKVRPDHPDANHNMGVLAVGLGKVSHALPFFRSAVDRSPAVVQFWLSYIDALMKLDKISEAKAALEQARKTGLSDERFDNLSNSLRMKSGNAALKTPSQDQLQSLVRLYEKGQFTAAIASVRVLLETFPKVEFLHNIQGACYSGLNNFDLAIKSYENVLLINPNHAEAYNNLGILLHKKNELEASIAQYEEALRLQPDYAEAHHNMGNTFIAMDRLDDAILSYERAVKIKPDYVSALCNLGSALRTRGDLDSAITRYSQAISIKPGYAEVHNNLGNVFQDKNDYSVAIEHYRQAIKIKPDYATAYGNIGHALQVRGKFFEAINNYRKAIKINPDFVDYYYNLANAQGDHGHLNDAIENYKIVIKKQPDNVSAYNNLGNIFRKQGNPGAAISSYKKAIELKPDDTKAYRNLGLVLKDVVFETSQNDLYNILIYLLKQKTLVRAKDICKAVISLLKHDPLFKKISYKSSNNYENASFEEVILDLNQSPLFLQLMRVCPILDIDIEEILKSLRREILLSIRTLKNVPAILNFQFNLAMQCFNNDYIYLESESEIVALDMLKLSVENSLAEGNEPNVREILCLTSYGPLNKLKWFDSPALPKIFNELEKLQLSEFKEERKLASAISPIGRICNGISLNVREQYESNPYPRWTNLSLPLEPKTVAEFIGNLQIFLHNKAVMEVKRPYILIAGCGTGQQSIEVAGSIIDSSVVAIDLSLTSLAYAKRKTEELGIKNIEYFQSDILNFKESETKFDIIESVGVLHHMDDPFAGWRTLVECLSMNGLLKIGLYSEKARQHITKIHKEIDYLDVKSDEKAMKIFRNKLACSDKQHHKIIVESSDFYNLSEFRDLLFHVREHHFSIPQIREILLELGLEFCGFESYNIVNKFKLENSGQNDCCNLEKWDVFETKNPRTFGGMYQFWCQKVR